MTTTPDETSGTEQVEDVDLPDTHDDDTDGEDVATEAKD